MFEFHISRHARDLYGVSDLLFSFTGNAIFANPAGSRAMAQRMNQLRNPENDPKKQVQPAALFAMGLIDEAAHALFAYYRKHVAPKVMQEALAYFSGAVGDEAFERLLLAFVQQFPPVAVYTGQVPAAEWLNATTEGLPHREAAIEELMLLWLENRNRAFAPFRELFDDTKLAESTAYTAVTQALPAFFATQPELGQGRGGVFSLLLSVLTAGDSLRDQLRLLRGRWGFAVDDLLRRLLLAGDVLHEEEIAVWLQFNPPSAETQARRQEFAGWGSPQAGVPNFTTSPVEYEAFSSDVEWMPVTVMIAKSTFVWLNQLSRFYSREIRTLDQIPDEELQTLASRGMNALWLIGVWERSRASQTIKRLCGNPDAVASAYSLYDYRIADSLGGEPAYENLRHRCARVGIRLASDMVPNHMGIDSTWVIEHPEWFLSRGDSPFPAYTFNGPDLSGDDRVEIKIEDHYYSRSDAAVVFQRRDKWTGETRFVYHGNDGTSIPWNDTAQLDYLHPAVREQVIQTILAVARKFPIIRFDAAMTLAKRHIQRLWFPNPGGGGAIPSRAESALTTEEFDRAIPQEFWREVVDRVAQEVPGTLLLAEAFWMMEGYFVRTLGMHRVYNSAFMVMLRDEDNANYRTLLKNTLEFDPGILKRYVNFMSNPDERTAIDQFGSGDKFFGVATMMATLPGLPMFGHGQIEGFTEKYGMEFYRPRFDEWPEQWMIDRHNREIAPLLHQRALFAESENFLLYDLWQEGGGVNENVFAYSNYYQGRRALVMYNNSYSRAAGTLHHSASYLDKAAGEMRQRALSDGLRLSSDGDAIYAWRNSKSGQWHLRRGSDLVNGGLHIALDGYGYAVLLDWRELRADATRGWDRLCDSLGGRGIDDLDRALLNLELRGTHNALRCLLEPRLVRDFIERVEAQVAQATLAGPARTSARLGEADGEASNDASNQWLGEAAKFVQLARAEYLTRVQPPPEQEPRLPAEQNPGFDDAEAQNEEALTATRLRERVEALLRLHTVEAQWSGPWPQEARTVLPSIHPAANAGAAWAPVLAYTVLAALGESLSMENATISALRAFDALGLREILAEAFRSFTFGGDDSWRGAARVRVAIAAGVLPSEPEPNGEHAEHMLEEDRGLLHGLPLEAWEEGDVRWLAGVNEHAGITWLNREAFTELLWWRALPDLLQLCAPSALDTQEMETLAARLQGAMASVRAAGYQLGTSGPAADVPTSATTTTASEGAHAPVEEHASAPAGVRGTLEPEMAFAEQHASTRANAELVETETPQRSLAQAGIEAPVEVVPVSGTGVEEQQPGVSAAVEDATLSGIGDLPAPPPGFHPHHGGTPAAVAMILHEHAPEETPSE